MLAHVPSFGRNLRGSPDFLAYPVPKACMHVLGTGFPRRLGVARSASSPKAAQALGCSLTPGLRISFGRVTCMARAASMPGLWTLGFLPLCGACDWVWVVLGFGFRLRPTTLGWGVRACVCLCACSACTPPLLAGVCRVGVCAWGRVSAAPRHSWRGCWGVCVFVCALRLYPAHSWLGCAVWVWVFGLGFRLRPATPGWGVGVCVCSCARSACTPPLLAGARVVGVCVWARVSAAPRHSWLGCAVWVWVFRLGFRLRPATPGWGVGVCVCWCARSPCTPPLLAGVCGVGVVVGARVSAAPRHSWLGCWGVRVCVRAPLVPRHSWLGCAVWVWVFGLGFRLRPATPGWDVRCGCVCWGSGFGCAPPLLAGVLGCVCAGVRAPLVPRHSWLGCAVWVCVFGLGFRLRPATLLAGVCGVGVCVGARVSAAPRHSWLGCWGVCVLVYALRLYPATLGWCVRCGCVCWGSSFGCAPPLLAGVLVCVCAGLRAPLVPRHSWLGCAVWVWVFGLGFRLRPATPGWGVGVCACWCACSSCTPPLLARVCVVGVCARACVLAAPRHSWPGFVVCGLAAAWHLFLCRGSLRVVRAARVSGTRWPLLLGTCPCALVVACGVPLRRASWPRVSAPRLVRSGRSRRSGRLSRRRGAFPQPGGLRPQLYWVAARGTRRPAEYRAHCACRWPPPRQGR